MPQWALYITSLGGFFAAATTGAVVPARLAVSNKVERAETMRFILLFSFDRLKAGSDCCDRVVIHQAGDRFACTTSRRNSIPRRNPGDRHEHLPPSQRCSARSAVGW